MERLLINREDVKQFNFIDPQYDQDRFNGFLRVVQQRNLKEFLGDPLYYDLMQNFGQSKYTSLLNGESYVYQGDTVQFYGLKPVLIHWWLAEVTRKGEGFITTYGNSEFVNNPQQQFEGVKNKNAIISEYMRNAQDFANDAIKYLDTKKDDFPLWDSKSEQSGTNFTFIKIS